jgi:outer membrane lipoprotein-sorting protein
MPVPSSLPPGGFQEGRAIVQQSQAKFKAMAGYETEMSYFQKMGAKTASGVYQLAGKQPRKLRIEIKQGNSTGTKLYWAGGSTIKVRPGGFLSAIALDLPLDDDRIISVRHYTLDQTDLPSMYNVMLDPANAVSTGEPGMVIVTGPRLLKGCVRMVARFDPTTSLPTSVEMSDTKEVVFRMQLRNFRRNDHVSLDI